MVSKVFIEEEGEISMRTFVVFTCFLSGFLLSRSGQEQPSYPSYNYDVARAHEIKPHRRTIPTEGVEAGFNQLRLTLVVSPAGDVTEADADAETKILKFWPQLQAEVRQWKFTPFEKDGKAVTAEIEEYIDLVPPERLPKKHVSPPALRPNSRVAITLERTGCLGTCPSYTVTVSADGIVFEGHGSVVGAGRHTDTVDLNEVRKLAKKFVSADFYSMDSAYRASVTDCPTYMLSIAIDGHKKEVEDYVGSWEGMPAIITELEDEVDALADTQRWIEGGKGFVDALEGERFDFQTFDAQIMLKEAASRGKADTVGELLGAGVPLKPLPAPKPEEPDMSVPFEDAGWLTSAAGNLDVLRTLIRAKASENDQNDKDLGLVGAARAGKVEAARALIAYGANPNADFSKVTVTESSGGMMLGWQGAGSLLIYAAESGNPEMVREILRFHPNLEARDHEGKTAVFAASEYRYQVEESARVECVRLLAEAGADVNARDNKGNTPLHETFLSEVEKELLRLGADVNARNDKGETPIFTTVDHNAFALFLENGADLSIRNNKGETVLQAAEKKGPARQEALLKAIAKANLH